MKHYVVVYESHLDEEFQVEILFVAHNMSDAQIYMRDNKGLVDQVAEDWELDEMSDDETAYWRGMSGWNDYAMLSIHCPTEEEA